jgi:hypothetical protein
VKNEKLKTKSEKGQGTGKMLILILDFKNFPSESEL